MIGALERKAWGGAPPWALGIAAVVLLLDQASKAAIRNRLTLHDEHTLIPGFLSLRHGENPGLAFGFLSSGPVPYQAALLTVMALTLVAGLLVFWRRVAATPLAHGALGLILGGALGNVIDRVRAGAVTDFVHVYWRHHIWPDFNVADSAICVAIVLLIVDSFRAPARDAAAVR